MAETPCESRGLVEAPAASSDATARRDSDATASLRTQSTHTSVSSKGLSFLSSSHSRVAQSSLSFFDAASREREREHQRRAPAYRVGAVDVAASAQFALDPRLCVRSI